MSASVDLGARAVEAGEDLRDVLQIEHDGDHGEDDVADLPHLVESGPQDSELGTRQAQVAQESLHNRGESVVVCIEDIPDRKPCSAGGTSHGGCVEAEERILGGQRIEAHVVAPNELVPVLEPPVRPPAKEDAEGGGALLSIDDPSVRHSTVGDVVGLAVCIAIPDQERPDRVVPPEGIDEVTNLLGRPDKATLKLGDTPSVGNCLVNDLLNSCLLEPHVALPVVVRRRKQSGH